MRRIFVKPPVQWMPGVVSRTLVRVALGLSLGLLAGLARMALSAQLQATVPYVLVFAFVTLSTVLGGWLSGIVTLALAQVVTWYFVLLPQSSFALDNPLGGRLGHCDGIGSVRCGDHRHLSAGGCTGTPRPRVGGP